MSFNFFVNSNITFGRGALACLADVIRGYGFKSAMIVYDEGVRAAGIAGKVLAQVKESGAEYIVFDGVIPNPTNEVVEEAADMAKKAGVDGFIAVGGGSSIDLAKAVNVLMTNPGRIGDYGGMNKVKTPCLPMIAIPTTAGTSSEITNVSALIDTEKVIKYVIIDNKLVATDVIADPELTATMPKSVTAATGMDAITHAVESYISNMATPLTEYNSLKGLEILYRNLPAAVENGNDMEAREQMMLGCIITGFAFSNANLGLVHGIAHTLSAHFGLAHGMANATVLPYVMRYNAESCPEKMAALAEAIGIDLSGEQEKDQYLLSDALLKLTRRLGIKTLSEQGIDEKDLDMVADDVLKEPVLGFNPRQGVTKEAVLDILKQAY
ncbi:iron-containing alcohol dehydrogenase [Hornefia butyriciproducens]|uniref:iron-containing alcohol dehydrogenase family protein n=1 Tax=Hornefia butyriciproducens TaxID=2652293 RepID=UPI002A91B2E5|nr:iron-containing alcohol dehydrogenase [Hornefia butyriciproducens]MDY5423443.1 iron-containing alcohol dehydrogenase [Hornefia butyriciproducens]